MNLYLVVATQRGTNWGKHIIVRANTMREAYKLAKAAWWSFDTFTGTLLPDNGHPSVVVSINTASR